MYRLLRAYGEHVQRSVSRCGLSDRQLAKLEQALQLGLEHRRDHVLFILLGSADSSSRWQGWTMGVPLDAPERTVCII